MTRVPARRLTTGDRGATPPLRRHPHTTIFGRSQENLRRARADDGRRRQGQGPYAIKIYHQRGSNANRHESSPAATIRYEGRGKGGFRAHGGEERKGLPRGAEGVWKPTPGRVGQGARHGSMAPSGIGRLRNHGQDRGVRGYRTIVAAGG
ncbi:MAG: hypothetical protein MZV70_56620 [Desulfobacterales bacterium]|nr:hypothetical protein [Desulfobacterales bacterium]